MNASTAMSHEFYHTITNSKKDLAVMDLLVFLATLRIISVKQSLDAQLNRPVDFT